jgi:hypothetical protein
MKTLLIILIAALSGLAGWLCNNSYQQHKKITITGLYPDERGYISVTFIQDGKEYGLDYLEKEEYLRLINKGEY